MISATFSLPARVVSGSCAGNRQMQKLLESRVMTRTDDLYIDFVRGWLAGYGECECATDNHLSLIEWLQSGGVVFALEWLHWYATCSG